MDLSKLDTTVSADQGSVMEVRHPVNGAVFPGMRITLHGVDSEKFKASVRKNTNRRLDNPQLKRTAEQFENDSIENLVAVTSAWTGIELDGKAIDCTPENIRLVYRRFPWLKEQVDEFIGNRANFLTVSQPT